MPSGAPPQDTEFLPECYANDPALRSKLVACVGALEDNCRKAILLYYFEAQPLDIVAKILGISRAEADSILRRARVALLNKLEPGQRETNLRGVAAQPPETSVIHRALQHHADELLSARQIQDIFTASQSTFGAAPLSTSTPEKEPT